MIHGGDSREPCDGGVGFDRICNRMAKLTQPPPDRPGVALKRVLFFFFFLVRGQSKAAVEEFEPPRGLQVFRQII